MVREKRVIMTNRAPEAIGPYSQAVAAGDFIFTAGQIPLRPDGTPVTGAIEQQTRQVLENLKAILEVGGSSLERVVKVTVYMTDLGQFAAMNQVYGEYFKVSPPARSAVGVASLPRGAAIEIEAVAVVKK